MQQLGLEILLILDEQREERRREEAIRLALLTANPDLARGLYPQYFAPVEMEEITDERSELSLTSPGTDYNFSGVEFEAPTERSAEWDMLASMLGDSSVTVTTPMAPTEGVSDNLRLLGEPDDGEWI